jgi:hypothetical protein
LCGKLNKSQNQPTILPELLSFAGKMLESFQFHSAFKKTEVLIHGFLIGIVNDLDVNEIVKPGGSAQSTGMVVEDWNH